MDMGKNYENIPVLVIASFVMSLIAGCGGGGSSVTPEAQQDTSTTTVTPGNLMASIPEPSYLVNSEEHFAFQLLNMERERCGFGLLAQNQKLDSSAMAHARWNLINNQVSHVEDGATFPNGFTGATPYARANFQGYTGIYQVGEVIATRSTLSKAQLGEFSIRGLLNAPFHLAHLMGSYTEVGFAIQSAQDVGMTVGNAQLVANLGYSSAAGRQEPASDVVQTYPCDGSTGVNFSLTGENPNPVPGRDLASDPLGVSVLIRVRSGQSLNVASASLNETDSGLSVELRGMVGGTNGVADNILNLFNTSRGYIAANHALKPDTRYSMVIEGTNDGKPFRKNFIFRTAQ